MCEVKCSARENGLVARRQLEKVQRYSLLRLCRSAVCLFKLNGVLNLLLQIVHWKGRELVDGELQVMTFMTVAVHDFGCGAREGCGLKSGK